MATRFYPPNIYRFLFEVAGQGSGGVGGLDEDFAGIRERRAKHGSLAVIRGEAYRLKGDIFDAF